MKVFVNVKCSDMFGCTVVNSKGDELLNYDGYVPAFMPGEHYGDYVELEIDVASGKILNWRPNAKELVRKFVLKNGEE